MPFPNYIGNKKFWTREKVIEGLKIAASQIPGQLTSNYKVYNRLKAYNHLDWPTSAAILDNFGSLGRGWLAAGIQKERISLANCKWTKEEEEYLLEQAGNELIKTLAKHLNRNYAGIRRKMYDLGITSRSNQGYLSAALLAKEYNCPYSRILDYLNTGIIPGKLCLRRHRWLIDPFHITPEIKLFLKQPKNTHKRFPPDTGDYYARYGITRTMLNGKLTKIEKGVIA